MFDFAWSEIALIGVVALIAIGPKDMPVAMKAVAGMVKKARRMAGEFQTHVDELVRDADLHEVRDQINQIRRFDFRGEVERAVDPDGSLRSTLATNPLAPTPSLPVAADAEPIAIREEHVIAALPAEATMPPVAPEPALQIGVAAELDEAPAFIPPEVVALRQALADAPAFIPPGTRRA
ncbi:MAG: twin-arginine translocase subunit TatB [Acidisphaera sp.]|nr:twin-arginine translocase subunit TatB [Acidisphaera sp.]